MAGLEPWGSGHAWQQRRPFHNRRRRATGFRPARGARLGELLVREGFVTSPQIDEALKMQASLERYGSARPRPHRPAADQPRPARLGPRAPPPQHATRRPARQERRDQPGAARRRARRAAAGGQPLGATLIRLNLVTEERMRLALCRQLHIRFFNLDAIIIDPTLRGAGQRAVRAQVTVSFRWPACPTRWWPPWTTRRWRGWWTTCTAARGCASR